MYTTRDDRVSLLDKSTRTLRVYVIVYSSATDVADSVTVSLFLSHNGCFLNLKF